MIKTLAIKRKVKCHFMKWGDNASEGGKHYNNSLFLFLQIGSSCFLSLEWVLKKVLWRNCKENLERSCRSWKRSKKDCENNKKLQMFCLYSLSLQKEVCVFLFQSILLLLLLRNILQYPNLRKLLRNQKNQKRL